MKEKESNIRKFGEKINEFEASKIENDRNTLDSIRARTLDQGEDKEEGEAGKSGLNLINK